MPTRELPLYLQEMQQQGVKNLLFDLGGVLYAIDVPRSAAAFRELLPQGSPFPDGEAILQHPLFQQLEVGALSPASFYTALRQEFSLDASDEALQAAWNALLLGPIAGRKELLEMLSGHFELYLLSNTNKIHFDYLEPQCRQLFELFEDVWLSFEMGLRKPQQEIFEFVCARSSITPEETLFIDDSAGHLAGAQQVGLKTFHFESEAKFLAQFFL